MGFHRVRSPVERPGRVPRCGSLQTYATRCIRPIYRTERPLSMMHRRQEAARRTKKPTRSSVTWNAASAPSDERLAVTVGSLPTVRGTRGFIPLSTLQHDPGGIPGLRVAPRGIPADIERGGLRVEIGVRDLDLQVRVARGVAVGRRRGLRVALGHEAQHERGEQQETKQRAGVNHWRADHWSADNENWRGNGTAYSDRRTRAGSTRAAGSDCQVTAPSASTSAATPMPRKTSGESSMRVAKFSSQRLMPR